MSNGRREGAALALKPSHPWLLLDDKELLTQLGGYRVDRREKIEGLTFAGMLMFGKISSIIDPYCCPAYFPDYREYLSNNPQDRWTDRICPNGTWEANLFQFYMRVFPKLSKALPTPFVLKDGVRVEDTPPHIALREAFINTLIHCDYTINSNITIELRRDKFIFSNPGSLLISISQYYRGGDSVCRNQSLQQMFMHLGSAEKAGSGVNKILQGWKDINFRSPQVEQKSQPDKVVLELPLVSLLSNEVIDYLKRLFGNNIMSIDHNKLLILATCYTEGEVTNNRLQLVVDMHRTDITKLLKELCNDGYLIPEGVGRGTRYKLQTQSSNVESNSNNDTLQNQILYLCQEYLSTEEIAVKTKKSVGY